MSSKPDPFQSFRLLNRFQACKVRASATRTRMDNAFQKVIESALLL